MSDPKVVRVKVETVSPQQRTIFLLLMGAGILIFGMVGQAYGVLDAIVSVLVVAAFHLAMNWKDPSGSAVARPSRMAGTLAQAQTDAPVLSLLLNRGSRLLELAKGLAKGALFLAAKAVFFHGYKILLTPINIVNQPLPWAGFAVLLVAAAAAWHWEGVMTAVRPLLRMRPTRTETPATTKDSDNA
ncbi:hypothetical protein [Arthrobacter sp. STN4]|uniref:hypothetical protein n=1 Tax=Arthrobacter sp. STN4 TaxID=2923276 RepID=UPI002119C382|nr:hypothetical protein [Arthrobacter sp. STN4]MCQ9162930.1 hypothetical protein [Arthrobacter sp. STN4]